MSDRLIMVSCDEHASPPASEYKPFMEAKHHARLDEWAAQSGLMLDAVWRVASIRPHQFDIADNDGALANGGLDGAWQPERRLEEMDREGIVFGIANPMANDTRTFHTSPFPHPYSDHAEAFGEYTAEEQVAGARAHNRWLEAFRDATDGRVHGNALVSPHLEGDDMVAELRWLAEHGFKVVTIPPPPLDDRYESFWAACEDLGLVVYAHAGHAGEGSGAMSNVADFKAPPLPEEQVANAIASGVQVADEHDGGVFMGANWEQFTDLSRDFSSPDIEVAQAQAGGTAFDLNLRDRAPIWRLAMTGVLDRHPGLRITFSEIRSDWVAPTLAHLDRRFAEIDVACELTPSEYFARNFHVAASFIRPLEVQLRHDIGVGHLMFSRDYPHPEGTWPNTFDWIRGAFAGVPEADARAILGENALEWFGFDRDRAAAIAARIGPSPDALLGDQVVDPRKLQYFHRQSNYYRPKLPMDPAVLDAELRMVMAD
jgi:predicted TIM-barrel fold metal-dependent hydrolase